MSLTVSAQTTSAISHYPISDRYVPYSFCTHHICHIPLPFISPIWPLEFFAHTTSPISHYPISHRYVPYSFCTHHICHISLSYIWPLCPLQFPHTSHLPYLTTLYLTAMSLTVFAQTTFAISHHPIPDRYVPYSFCTHHICHISLPYIWPLCPLQFLHTPHLPYLTILYLTAMSLTVSAHTTFAISHYPISDHYVSYSFCTHHICHISLPYIWPICPLQFLHTPHLPYLTALYLTDMSLTVSAHTTSAVFYYPISDRYLLTHVIYQRKIIYFLRNFSYRYGPKPSFVCIFYIKFCVRDFSCVCIIATNRC
jgi:hypothetical protein